MTDHQPARPVPDTRWIFRAIQPELDRLSEGKREDRSNNEYRSSGMLEAANLIASAVTEAAQPSDGAGVPVGWKSIGSAPKDGTRILLWLGAPWNCAEMAAWYAPWGNWQTDRYFAPLPGDEYSGIGAAVPTHWQAIDAPNLPATPNALPSTDAALRAAQLASTDLVEVLSPSTVGEVERLRQLLEKAYDGFIDLDGYAKEYRRTMDRDVVHSWAPDIVAAANKVRDLRESILSAMRALASPSPVASGAGGTCPCTVCSEARAATPQVPNDEVRAAIIRDLAVERGRYREHSDTWRAFGFCIDIAQKAALATERGA